MEYCTSLELVSDELNDNGRKNLSKIVPGAEDDSVVAIELLMDNRWVYFEVFKLSVKYPITNERVIAALNTSNKNCWIR